MTAKERDLARHQAERAHRAGLLTAESCQDCGGPSEQKHHTDYGRALEVVWLCKACHCARHGKAYTPPLTSERRARAWQLARLLRK